MQIMAGQGCSTQIWGALGLQVLNAEMRDGSQVCCRQLKQMLGGVSLTWTQLKLFFLEPQALRKVKNLIFVTGGGVTGCVQEESCNLPTLI